MKTIVDYASKNFARISLVALACVLGALTYNKWNKELKLIKSNLKRLSLGQPLKGKEAILNKDIPLSMRLPRALQRVPLADKKGIVLGTKTIAVRNVIAPYNASIIEKDTGDGYLLFFRYDVLLTHRSLRARFPFFTNIGCVELDENFEQTEKEFVRIDTRSSFSEDPRVIRLKDKLFISYNDLLTDSHDERAIRIASLDPKTLQTNYITELDLQIQHIEKNWAPFCYTTESGKDEIYFEYELQPHKIYKLQDPKTNSMVRMIWPKGPRLQTMPWPGIWGHPRGGTPPRLIDGQYLAFFHSSFRDESGIPTYVIGAYTFEGHPPFKITSISNHPIVFEGIYETAPINTAPVNLNALFPSGFALGKRNGKDVIHLSCGENDCAVKVVTIDKETLFKNMKKIKQS